MAEEVKGKGLKAFINGLSKKEKTLAYVSSFFILLVIMDRMVLLPLINRINNLDELILFQRNTIRDGLLILGYKDKIDADFKTLESFYSSEKKSDEEEFAAFLKEMENVANTSGIHIISISPTGNIENAKLYTKYEVKVDCTGQMDSIMQFLYNISASVNLIKVESIEITPPAKGAGEMKCSMIISKELVA